MSVSDRVGGCFNPRLQLCRLKPQNGLGAASVTVSCLPCAAAVRARPAVLLAMPTRKEKNAASTAWRICVDRSVPAASFQKKMQMAVERRQVHLEFRVIACILVELRWPRAVKYDVVQKFVKQAIPYEFDIRPAALEEQEAADAAVSAAA